MKAKLKTSKLLKSPTQLSSLWLATLLLSLSPLKAVASSFSSFIFFGDSITDPGNVFYALDGEITEPPFGGLVPQRPYSSKTFSNERVWAQYLADFYDLSGEAFLNPGMPGTNFAFGGATNQPLAQIPSPSLGEQLGFWQQATGNIADPNAVYFLQGGGNDIRLAATLDNSLEAGVLIQNAVDSLDTIIGSLSNAGANKIVVLNAPDVGLSPDARFRGIDNRATDLSQLYNTSLEQTLTSWESEELNLITVDLFDFIRSLTNEPTKFDLPTDTVTDLPCILPDSVCDDPNQYVFYDGLHATSVVQFQLARLVERQLRSTPEPSPLIMGIGFLFVLAKGKTKTPS